MHITSRSHAWAICTCTGLLCNGAGLHIGHTSILRFKLVFLQIIQVVNSPAWGTIGIFCLGMLERLHPWISL